jgi:hypothetical protein
MTHPESWPDLFLLLTFEVSVYYVCGHKLFTALHNVCEAQSTRGFQATVCCA